MSTRPPGSGKSTLSTPLRSMPSACPAARFHGILARLNLSDDEVAMVMGHEMAHALREHARARLAKTRLTGLGAQALSQLLGLGDLGNAGLSAGAQLLTLRFSRGDESEADLIGMELAAR